MAEHSTIEWTDTTWNPVTGCDKVSPGCDRCYAEAIARRFAGTPAFPDGFAVTLRPDRLTAPLRWRSPRRVFVNSMSDLFHPRVPDEFIARVWSVMARTPQHTYQVLTKRHARMRALLTRATFAHQVAQAGRDHYAGSQHDWMAAGRMLGGDPLPNVWLGVSAENQQWADIRIPALLDTPAAVRFISAEPLLGPVDLTRSMRWHEHRLLHWVIAGGESGPGARPMHPAWPRSLRDQCRNTGVAFFFKQWGHWRPGVDSTRPTRYVLPNGSIDPSGYGPLDPGAAAMVPVGKHAAGRLLDGRTHDQYPQPASGAGTGAAAA